MQENQDLFHEYLKAYTEFQALSGQLASARSELARRAEALCQTYAAAAKGMPIVVNSPFGIISLTLDEEWFDCPESKFVQYFSQDAVKLQHLQQIQDVEQELAERKETEEALANFTIDLSKFPGFTG